MSLRSSLKASRSTLPRLVKRPRRSALVVGVLREGAERRGRVLRLLGADGRGRGPGRRRGPARGPPPGGRPRLDPAAGAGTGEALIAPPQRRCPPWPPSGGPPVPRTCSRARASCRPAPATGLLRRRRGGRLPARRPPSAGARPRRGPSPSLRLRGARRWRRRPSSPRPGARRSSFIRRSVAAAVALSTALSAALSEYSAAPSSKVSLLTFVERSTQTLWRGGASGVPCSTDLFGFTTGTTNTGVERRPEGVST